MSFPINNYGIGSDATHGNDNSAAPARESSATPYTDFVYGQIAHGAQELIPELEEGFFTVEDVEDEGDHSEVAGPGYVYPDPLQLVEDDGDADTVLGDPVVGVVEDDESEDDEDDDEYGSNLLPVDYAELQATVANPLRQRRVANWQNDLASLPASHVTEWLQEGGRDTLADAASAKFEAVMGFPREFLALKTITGPDGTPVMVRDLEEFYRLLQGLWDVKVRTAAVIFSHSNRSSYAPGGNDKIDRRRKLLSAGQSYWTHPTPLRQVCVPGAEEGNDHRAGSSEIDEDELVEMYMQAYPEEMNLDVGDSREVERMDGDWTHGGAAMSLEEQQASVRDVTINPELQHDLELLARAYDDYQTHGDMSPDPPFRLDGWTDEQGTATQAADNFSCIDPWLLDLESGGEVVGLDDAPRYEVVASDSAAAADPLSLENQQAAVTDASCVTWADGYVTPREVVVDEDVAPLTEVVADYVTPRLVVVDDDATPGDLALADGRADSITEQEERASVSRTDEEETTDASVGRPEYDEVESDSDESRFDLELEDLPLEAILSDDGQTSTDSSVSGDEQVEDNQSEPASDAATEAATPVAVDGATGLAWRLLGDLNYITNAERIAISDPANLCVEDQIFRMEMETADMQQTMERDRRGHYGLHRMWIKHQDPTNNWAHYWHREDARRMGRVL